MNQNHLIAGKALRTMFIGQVLSIIGLVLGLIPLIGGIGSILIFAGGIVALVGLISARPAHAGYRKAVLMILLTILLTVLTTILATAAILTSSGGVLLAVTVVMPVVSYIVSFMQVYFVCTATAQLMSEAGNEVGATKGAMVWKLNLVCYLLSGVFTVLMFISIALAGIGGIVVSIISIVSSVVYLALLNDGAKTLGG